jgi:hypothetical protein
VLRFSKGFAPPGSNVKSEVRSPTAQQGARFNQVAYAVTSPSSRCFEPNVGESVFYDL